MALLELRCRLNPEATAKYLLPKLPHKNPPKGTGMRLEDLGAKVHFARICSALAQDPNLSAFLPEKDEKAAGEQPPKKKGIFSFLFTKTKNAFTGGAARKPYLKRNDPLGVEFAEALVFLLRNPSNRVLIEALRGFSARKWSTWADAPVPQGALYNSPDLDMGAVAKLSSDEEEEHEIDDMSDVFTEDEEEKGDEDAEPTEEAVELTNDGAKAERDGFFKKRKAARKAARQLANDKATPFYMRKLSAGTVPALEVVLRRIYASMLSDETLRRFAGVDAAIELARAKLFSETAEDKMRIQAARQAYQSELSSGKSKGAVVGTTPAVPLDALNVPGMKADVALAGITESSTVSTTDNPLGCLLGVLRDLVINDESAYVRGRAATALAYVLASGYKSEEEDSAVLFRTLKDFFTSDLSGTGHGLAICGAIINALVNEILAVKPDFGQGTLALMEAWAMRHPNQVTCGKLLTSWEFMLEYRNQESGLFVSKSVFRCLGSSPIHERLAAAAAIFLRRRVLDLAVLSTGSAEQMGTGVPEPLPRDIGIEMEKYFSALWHRAILGASAECRVLCVEALGGAATLAGEPFRISTYERLVELIKGRGLGLRVPAQFVLDALDAMYFSREACAEARGKMKALGAKASKSMWQKGVWKLAAQSAAAAQILLGCPPPMEWHPLGPESKQDVFDAIEKLGDFRNTEKRRMQEEEQAIQEAQLKAQAAMGQAALGVPTLMPGAGQGGGPGAMNSGQINFNAANYPQGGFPQIQGGPSGNNYAPQGPPPGSYR